MKISKGVPRTQRYPLRALMRAHEDEFFGIRVSDFWCFQNCSSITTVASTAIRRAQKRTLQERSFRYIMVGRSHSQFIVSLILYCYFHWAQYEILYIPPFELSLRLTQKKLL